MDNLVKEGEQMLDGGNNNQGQGQGNDNQGGGQQQSGNSGNSGGGSFLSNVEHNGEDAYVNQGKCTILS